LGSLTGAVASERVTEALKGSLSTVGNRAKSVKAKESLTARKTFRAGTKVGLSDPVAPNGRAIA
jgi:lipopolysaccharide/colanic/teichoic acid biosynthesis glycosyltransferase